MDSEGSLFTKNPDPQIHTQFALLFFFVFFFPRIKQKTFKTYMHLLSLKMCGLGLLTCT